MDVTVTFYSQGEILAGKIIGMTYCGDKIIGYVIRGNNRKDYPFISISKIININDKTDF